VIEGTNDNSLTGDRRWRQQMDRRYGRDLSRHTHPGGKWAWGGGGGGSEGRTTAEDATTATNGAQRMTGKTLGRGWSRGSADLGFTPVGHVCGKRR
jgi:hypothetical protein